MKLLQRALRLAWCAPVALVVACGGAEPPGDGSPRTAAGRGAPAPPAATQALATAFQRDLVERLEASGDNLVIRGDDGWLFFAPELRHLTVGPYWGDAAAAVSQSPAPEHADPLPAIVDFHRQLRDQGVDLLVVPVPAKATIVPDAVSPAVGAAVADTSAAPPPRLDEHDAAFLEILRGEGIDVLDLTHAFLENRHHPAGDLYCRQDTHWSGNACVLAAERLASLVRAKPWFDGVTMTTYEAEWREVEISGDLWRILQGEGLPRETLRLRFVRSGFGPAGDQASGLVEPDPDSPILLLGDSHGLVFHAGGDMLAEGAGLADQLAYELGFPMDVIAVRGSGATPARFNLLRRARRTDGYWQRKRLVIWVFSVREFTQADGWRVMPIGAE